ncbi:MAG: response regulator [Alphaproteobacteria bacterium]|nr:response regulator [Alphaproteobacteria bacterium]
MSRYRILYVDDEADIREVACLALELDEEIETLACPSGAQAVEVAPRWQPHLILLDYIMPELDGPGTLKRLRENPELQTIPVAFVTARTQAHDVAKLITLGAAGVIPKPFDPQTFASMAKRFLA